MPTPGAGSQRQGQSQQRRHRDQAGIPQAGSDQPAGAGLEHGAQRANRDRCPERAGCHRVVHLGALHQRIGEQGVHTDPKDDVQSNGGGADAELARPDQPGDNKGRDEGQCSGDRRFKPGPEDVAGRRRCHVTAAGRAGRASVSADAKRIAYASLSQRFPWSAAGGPCLARHSRVFRDWWCMLAADGPGTRRKAFAVPDAARACRIAAQSGQSTARAGLIAAREGLIAARGGRTAARSAEGAVQTARASPFASEGSTCGSAGSLLEILRASATLLNSTTTGPSSMTLLP